DTGVLSEQYAENIGMLRRVVETFAGPRKFDLVWARVGNLEIDALRRGSFSISIDANLNAILRLQTNPPDALRLSFPTAQEFDVVVRDSAGNIVWQWSDGQVFDQAAHQKTIAGLWTIPVAIPRPAQPGAYIIEARLVTTSPQFSAAVPLTIAPDPQEK